MPLEHVQHKHASPSPASSAGVALVEQHDMSLRRGSGGGSLNVVRVVPLLADEARGKCAARRRLADSPICFSSRRRSCCAGACDAELLDCVEECAQVVDELGVVLRSGPSAWSGAD
jgi:hypothetical protein